MSGSTPIGNPRKNFSSEPGHCAASASSVRATCSGLSDASAFDSNQRACELTRARWRRMKKKSAFAFGEHFFARLREEAPFAPGKAVDAALGNFLEQWVDFLRQK